MAEQQQLHALIEVAHNTLTLFSAGVQDDLDKIDNVHSALNSLQQKRAKELDGQRDVLRALARQYELQKQASTRPSSVPSEKAHREKLQSLDSEKYALAKVIASLESDVGALEAALAKKRDQVKGFDETDDAALLASSSGQGIAEVLRLKIYRDLGFVPVPADDGSYTKMLVSSSDKAEVHTVACKPQRQQEAFTMVNKLWDYSE